METDPTRMCELLVGLPEVHILGVDDQVNGFVRIYIESRAGTTGVCLLWRVGADEGSQRPSSWSTCRVLGVRPASSGTSAAGSAPSPTCPVGSWTEEDERIGAPRMAISDRAGRWVTEQVGRYARSVNEIAAELGCDWHTVNDTVIAYGTALVDDDPDRYRDRRRPRARRGALRPRRPSSVARSSPPRSSTSASASFSTSSLVAAVLDPPPGSRRKDKVWRDQVRYATLDLSSPYRAVFSTMLPDAVQVADPFHVVKARQHQARRVPPPGAERDHGTPRSQDRSALPLPAPAHQGRRAT